MRFEVGEQLREPVGTVHTYHLEERMGLGEGEEFPVAGELRFTRTSHGLLITADLEATMEACCNRCLDSFTLSLPVHIEEEFFPISDPWKGGRLAVPEDAFTIDAHQVLDLTEALRQYILLQMPMKQLCRPDCRGLCSRCGYDLNLGPHSCPRD
jgi:uncharacterized protein